MSENLNATNRHSTGVRQIGPVFNHPDDVLGDAMLTRDEKRALLASWASDACSVEGAPALRRLGSGAVVSLADILASLRALDAGDDRVSHIRRARRSWDIDRHVPHRRSPHRIMPGAHNNDDDDDPPPSPAAAHPWMPISVVNAQAA